jgi:phosphoribosylformylglycinamidine synthase
MDGPSDGAVLKPIQTPGKVGIVLSNGFNPEYGKFDSYRMAVSAVDEAVRNAVCCGVDPDRLAILDNFCWGDPLRPETMWTILESARGCYDAAITHQTPFISGKDSFNNEYLTREGVRQSIPASLLISAIGIIPDVSRAVTMDLKKAGSSLYLLGDFQPTFGGSHYAALFGSPTILEEVPAPVPHAPLLYRKLFSMIREGNLILACHDLSEGGLAVSLAEMCIAGRLGAEVTFPAGQVCAQLFGETNGCLLVEVASGREPIFESRLAGLPQIRLGRVSGEAVLSIQQGETALLSESVARLVSAWQGERPQ